MPSGSAYYGRAEIAATWLLAQPGDVFMHFFEA
jgi:hypothetical protein